MNKSPHTKKYMSLDGNAMQNVITAMSSIKAKIYDLHTQVTPSLMGFDNTLSEDDAVINAFISRALNNAEIFLSVQHEKSHKNNNLRYSIEECLRL